MPGAESYNEELNEFSYAPDTLIYLEHSLKSISEWEAKYHKPFMSNDPKDVDEIMYYIQCMCLDESYKEILDRLTSDNYTTINEYISDSQTATWFDDTGKRSSEIVTSELVYYWMISFQIPIECENWHINRLLTLIRVCSVKNAPEKEIPKNELMARNSRLNAERRRKYNTKG